MKKDEGQNNRRKHRRLLRSLRMARLQPISQSTLRALIYKYSIGLPRARTDDVWYSFTSEQVKEWREGISKIWSNDVADHGIEWMPIELEIKR